MLEFQCALRALDVLDFIRLNLRPNIAGFQNLGCQMTDLWNSNLVDLVVAWCSHAVKLCQLLYLSAKWLSFVAIAAANLLMCLVQVKMEDRLSEPMYLLAKCLVMTIVKLPMCLAFVTAV